MAALPAHKAERHNFVLLYNEGDLLALYFNVLLLTALVIGCNER